MNVKPWKRGDRATALDSNVPYVKLKWSLNRDLGNHHCVSSVCQGHPVGAGKALGTKRWEPGTALHGSLMLN